MPSNGKEKPSGGYGVQPSKLFIGGLSFDTTDDKLKAFFKKYGSVSDAVVMRDPSTRRSRGFGFVTFSDSSSADAAMSASEHVIDGRRVEAKRAVPREDNSRGDNSVVSSSAPVVRKTTTNTSSSSSSSATMSSMSEARRQAILSCKKIFVGGLHYETCDETLKKYFSSFGNVESVQVMYNRETNKSRGFGFVNFDSETAVAKVLQNRMHNIDNKSVEVKRAVPKADAPPGKVERGGNSNSSYVSSNGTNSNSGSSTSSNGGSTGSYNQRTRNSRGGPRTNVSTSVKTRPGTNNRASAATRSNNVRTTTMTSKPVVPVKNAWSVPLASAWSRGSAADKLKMKVSSKGNSNAASSKMATTTTTTKSIVLDKSNAEEKKQQVIETSPTSSSEDVKKSSQNSPMQQDSSNVGGVIDAQQQQLPPSTTNNTNSQVTSSRMAFAKIDGTNMPPTSNMFGGQHSFSPMPSNSMWLGGLGGGHQQAPRPSNQSTLMSTFRRAGEEIPTRSGDDADVKQDKSAEKSMTSRMNNLSFSNNLESSGMGGNMLPRPHHQQQQQQQQQVPFGMNGSRFSGMFGGPQHHHPGTQDQFRSPMQQQYPPYNMSSFAPPPGQDPRYVPRPQNTSNTMPFGAGWGRQHFATMPQQQQQQQQQQQGHPRSQQQQQQHHALPPHLYGGHPYGGHPQMVPRFGGNMFMGVGSTQFSGMAQPKQPQTSSSSTEGSK